MERPLSTFVVIAFILGVGALADASKWWLQLFGIVYILFALYFQNKVWKVIMEMDHTFIPEEESSWGSSMAGFGGQTNQPTYTGKMLVPKNVVQEAFKKVFLEDFIVLGFFIATMIVFFKSMQGDNVSGLLFFWAAAIYSACWYCCECCAGTVRVDSSEVKPNGIEGGFDTGLYPSAPPVE